MNAFDKIFGSARAQFYAEAATGEGVIENVQINDDEVKVETADGGEITAPVDTNPSLEVEVPVEEGKTVENVEITVEYAEKCAMKAARYAESVIDALEAGAAAVIEDGGMKVGTVDVLPESENKAEGEVTLGDMNSERIIPEETAKTDDGSFENY